jgi:sulfur relay (sulfurtransferase) DsrF/TusC family protein
MTSEYLLVETHGLWAGPGGARFIEDAGALVASGERVMLLLIQDGVTSALPAQPGLGELIEGGASVCVDRLSLAQRALAPKSLHEDVRVVEIEMLARKLLEPGVRVVWH